MRSGSTEPDADKFREIAEAYQVLSQRESRVSYDLKVKKNPEVMGEKAFEHHQQQMEIRSKQRDRSGHAPVKTDRGTFAERRLKELEKERDKFNVNYLGYYKGGVPKKGMGITRGKSLLGPGWFHLPAVHNFKENLHPDASFVTSEDTIKFKRWMNSDKYDF